MSKITSIHVPFFHLPLLHSIKSICSRKDSTFRLFSFFDYFFSWFLSIVARIQNGENIIIIKKSLVYQARFRGGKRNLMEVVVFFLSYCSICLFEWFGLLFCSVSNCKESTFFLFRVSWTRIRHLCVANTHTRTQWARKKGLIMNV